MHVKSNGIKKAEAVEPIKNPKDIKKIKQYLIGKDNKRDYLLFTLGINVGLRAGDLLSLKIKDVLNTDSVSMIEEKTGKTRRFKLNDTVKEAIGIYLKSIPPYEKDDYLFKSRKGNESLRVDSTHKIIKSLMKELNIKGNFGTHTLRKTWAYHVYMNNCNNPRALITLQKALNHSSQAVTLRYIGIEQEEIDDLYELNI